MDKIDSPPAPGTEGRECAGTPMSWAGSTMPPPSPQGGSTLKQPLAPVEIADPVEMADPVEFADHRSSRVQYATEHRPYAEFIFLGAMSLFCYNCFIASSGTIAPLMPAGMHLMSIWPMLYSVLVNVCQFSFVFGLMDRLPFAGRFYTSTIILTFFVVLVTSSFMVDPIRGTHTAGAVMLAGICCLGFGGALLGACVFGLAGATHDPRLTTCIMVGQGVGGVAGGCIGIFLTDDAKPWQWAVVLGVCAALTLSCAGLMFLLQRNRLIHHALLRMTKPLESDDPADPVEADDPAAASSAAESGVMNDYLEAQLIAKDSLDALSPRHGARHGLALYVTCLDVAWPSMLTFLVTFALFPAITLTLTPMDGSSIESKFGGILTTTFMVGDLVGRAMPQVPWLMPKSIFPTQFSAVARVGFVPLMVGMRFYVHAPFLSHDAFKVVVVLALAATNGWVSTVGMSQQGMNCNYTAEEGNKIGVFMSSVLTLGIFVGALVAIGLNTIPFPGSA